MIRKERSFKNWLFPVVMVVAPVALCYLPSLTGQFIRDDHDLIEKNTYIREIHPISSYFKQEDGEGDTHA